MARLAAAFEMDLAAAGAGEPKWPMVNYRVCPHLRSWVMGGDCGAVHLIWQMR